MYFLYTDSTGTPGRCDVFVRGNLVVFRERADNTARSPQNEIGTLARQWCTMFHILPKDLVLAQRPPREAQKEANACWLYHFFGGSGGPDGRFLAPHRYAVHPQLLHTLDCTGPAGAEAVRQLVQLKETLGA